MEDMEYIFNIISRDMETQLHVGLEDRVKMSRLHVTQGKEILFVFIFL